MSAWWGGDDSRRVTEDTWYAWKIGEFELHLVPEIERQRHRPTECWCDPVLDVGEDGVARFTHRLQWVDNTLQRRQP